MVIFKKCKKGVTVTLNGDITDIAEELIFILLHHREIIDDFTKEVGKYEKHKKYK